MGKRGSTRCVHCGGDRGRNHRYCSNRCQKAFEWARRCREIEAVSEIPKGLPRAARRYLIQTNGHRCGICGGTDWQGQLMPLVLDHINGNSDDWRLSNLRLVCPNCDALLPTFKSRNRGKGRASRRKRYADGLSY